MEKETISLKMQSRTGVSVTFHLGMISPADDTEFSMRFNDLADLPSQEKSKREYQIYVDALSAWSAEMPTRQNGDGEKPLGEGSPTDAIKAFFSERTNAKEWLAVSTISSFRNSLFWAPNFQ